MPSKRPPRGSNAPTGRSGRSEGASGGRKGPGKPPARGASGSSRSSNTRSSAGAWSDRPDRPARAGKSERDERPAPRGGRFARTDKISGPRAERPRREEAPRKPAPPREAPPAVEIDEMAPVTTSERDIVYGRHAVQAALSGDQPINKVWILNGLQNQALVAKVRQLAKEKGASVQMVERPKLDALTLDANHQGLVASIAAAAYFEIEDVIEKALASKFPALLLLDGIEDPHNLGALLRTAEAADFAGVIIPTRRAVGLTPVAFKSSAGAAARVPVARVGNLAQAAATLKKAGFWLMGADAEGEKLPYEIDMTQPLVLVVGSEGKGLSRLLAEKCDYVVRLPLGGEMESLNASVAGGVLMYEAVRQRWAKG